MKILIHFWLKSGKVRELESQKVRESLGTALTKNGWKTWRGVTQFWRNCRAESLFAKSKVTNLKDSRVFLQKSIHILKTPCLEFFWNSSNSWKETRSALHVLCQAIKIRVTWLDLVQMDFTLSLVREICKLGDVAYFDEFYKLGKNLFLNFDNAS